MPFLRPDVDNIPAELKEIHHWVCWKEEPREGEDKPTKPPYQVNGRLAKTNDPKTWTSFSKVITALNNNGRYHGIGFCLGDGTPIGIDLDECRCPAFADVILPWAREIIEDIDSYTEASPSGKGIRIFVNGGPLPPQGRKKGPIEIYEKGRFLTVTGKHILDTPKTINDRTEAVLAFHRRIFGTKVEDKPPAEIVQPEQNMDVAQWLKKAFSSKNGEDIRRLYKGDWTVFPSQSEADLSLCSHLAFWFNGDAVAVDQAFRESGLYRDKWDERHHGDGKTYGQGTIDKAIRGCKDFYKEPGRADHAELTPNGKASESGSPLTFPSHVITGAAGYFADVLADILEPPAHFFFLGYLTCLGSLLSDKVTLKSELRPQPRLYLVFLGESADDRKSTAINKATSFYQYAVSGFPVCFGVGSAEGLQRRMTKDPRLLLVYDELKSFVGKAKVDNSVLLPLTATLFESNNFESHTKDREVSLTGAYLSIMAASTIETYERTWDSSFQDIGMTNRLFIVPGQGHRRFAIPGEVPTHERDIMKYELAKVLRSATMTPELSVTPVARALYEDWYLNLEQSIHTKRLDAYALRFMILFAVNSCKQEVDEVVVQNVIDLMNWELQARKLYDPIDADSAVAKIEEKIRRVLSTGSRSDRDLKRAVHYNRIGTWVFNMGIKNLVGSREVCFDKRANEWRLTA